MSAYLDSASCPKQGGKVVKKQKKAREEAKDAPAGTKEARKDLKKRIRPTREEKGKWVLDLLESHGCLAFTELWQIAGGEKGSPFRGGSESTLRRVVKTLAKQGKVNLPRTPKGAILVELPSVTAANAGCDENPSDVNGEKPAGDVAGAAPAGSADAVLDEMASDAAERGMREIEEELNKPRERLKTQAEIDAELAPMRERAAALHRELGALERKIQDVECVWADRHLILTTAPLPEAPETLIVN